MNLVVEKLMNLGGPENEDELKDGGEAIGFSSVILESQNGTGHRELDCTAFEDDEIQGMMITKHSCISGSKEISQMGFRPEISIQQLHF